MPNNLDMATLVRMLMGQGRGGDTELAHVNPEEKQLLEAMGGSGTINPQTGLREFAQADYLQRYPDVKAAGIDPWTHYQTYGQKEGRLWDVPNTPSGYSRNDPMAQAYLNMYPDVKAAGVDPWTHYNQYGKNEGRTWGGGITTQPTTPKSQPQPGTTGGTSGAGYTNITDAYKHLLTGNENVVEYLDKIYAYNPDTLAYREIGGTPTTYDQRMDSWKAGGNTDIPDYMPTTSYYNMNLGSSGKLAGHDLSRDEEFINTMLGGNYRPGGNESNWDHFLRALGVTAATIAPVMGGAYAAGGIGAISPAAAGAAGAAGATAAGAGAGALGMEIPMAAAGYPVQLGGLTAAQQAALLGTSAAGATAATTAATTAGSAAPATAATTGSIITPASVTAATGVGGLGLAASQLANGDDDPNWTATGLPDDPNPPQDLPGDDDDNLWNTLGSALGVGGSALKYLLGGSSGSGGLLSLLGGGGLGSLLPLLLGGGASLFGANAQRQANADLTRENLANWKEYAFPNKEKMDALRSKGISDINRRYAGSAENIYEQMAARGLSGNIVGADIAGLERSKNRDFANLSRDLTAFENTPYSAPPVTIAPSVSGGAQLADMLTGLGGTYAGYDFAKNMYGNNNNSDLASLVKLLYGVL